RADIVMAWTFTIVDAGEMTFDPANSIVPFPNDVLRANGTVNLPGCTSATDPLTQITCGLNTLDGFSTLAPPVSESSDTAAAVQQASIDAASLDAASVGLARAATDLPQDQQ